MSTPTKKLTKLTPKREKFCQCIVAGFNQSDAYRKAFNSKNMMDKTIHERASVLMKHDKIKARIAELMAPVVAKVQVTRDQWLQKMEGYFHADVRKMFSGPGNAIDIQDLGDNEALMVEGFELVENFEKVGDKAEHVGYTKKIKLTPKLKAMLEFGKVMGWHSEAPPPASTSLVVIMRRGDGGSTPAAPIDVTPTTIQPTGESRGDSMPRVKFERRA